MIALPLVIALLLQAPVARTPPSSTSAARAPRTLRSIDRGDQSNVDEAREVVVRSEAEWAALWRQHGPDRPRPPVDFTKEMVVGVFLGSRTTAGFSVEIVGVEPSGGGLAARYRVARPAAEAVTAQVLVFPYHLVAVPARTGTVRFEPVD